MYVKPISKIDNRQTSFNGAFNPINKILNPKNVEEQIKKISENREARDIFKGLSILATSIIAEVTMFAHQNDDAKCVINGFLNELDASGNGELKDKITQLINGNIPEKKELPVFDLAKIKEEKPEREVYLKLTSYFPNLDSKYKQLLQTSVHEPENEKNKFVLSSLENIFKMFCSSETKLMYMKPYMDVLDKKYSNCLDGIAENLASTVENGNSPMHYLVLLHNEAISQEDIYRWAKNRNLSCDEFMMTRDLNDEQLERLNKLKETNNHFTIKKCIPLEDDKFDLQTYAFKLDFEPENLSLAKMLKTAAEVHEAIYGGIYLKEEKDSNDNYLVEDIQTELVDNILKDRRMDSTYNFIKYVKPSALSEFDYTADEVKFLTKENKEYNKIKSICSHALMNLDFDNPKLKVLCDILNDDRMFGKIITNRHSRIRFMTRFVLKDNPNPLNLQADTYEKLNILYDELRNNQPNCNYFCYKHSKGTAPQFYIRNSRLGSFVKVTLNNEGSIHTIYEDFNKELKFKNEGSNSID